MDKLKGISNPIEVIKKGQALHLNPILVSTRKDKKYMVSNGKKMIHFGAIGYEDYTIHKDEKRRKNFQNRNRLWKDAPTYTPRYLSYHLLW